MKSFLPPSPASILNIFRNPLALLGGVLLCVAPVAVQAQSVTFGSAQETLPLTGLSSPLGVAVDRAGDVFLTYGDTVADLPKLAAGYGPQTALPFNGLSDPRSVALDSGGNLFVADTGNSRIVELLKTSTGYGSQTTVPANGLIHPWGVVIDSAGDLFIADTGNDRVVELPKTGTSYGAQATLATGLADLNAIAMDSAGDLFLSGGGGYNEPPGSLVELPRAGSGYGRPITLPFTGLSSPEGIAVDSAGDVFVADISNGRVLELPKTSTGYGLQATLSAIGLVDPRGIALDSAGDLFITDTYAKRVVELQIQTPINLGGAYVCVSGQTDPAPCSQSLPLLYNITASGRLGTPRVLTDGEPDLDFTLGGGSTCSGAVKESKTCTVNVTFAPQIVGARNGAVEITDTSGTVLATTPLYATGVAPPPVAQVSTTYLGFGTIPVGDTKSLSLTVTNIGGGTLTITPVITGYSTPPPSAYSYTVTDNTCGAGLTFGNSCTLEVQFSPTFVGTHDDLLTLQTNGTTNPAIGLGGVASAGGVVVSGGPLQFGTVPYGSSAVLLLTITNYGLSGAVTVSAMSSPSYSVLTTAQNTCQAGVTSGHSCTLPVHFTPDSVGAHNGILSLTPSSGGAAIPVPVAGIGSGLGGSPSVLQFGNVTSGSSEVVTLTVTNVGLGPVTVGTAVNEDNFSVLTTTQNTCQSALPEGQSCTLPVEFSSSSLGYHYGILTLTPSAGAAATLVGLEGTGVALAQSVTFAGSPSTLVPMTQDVSPVDGFAVDSAANVFVTVPYSDAYCYSNYGYGDYGECPQDYQAAELPRTALGYGPLTSVPAFPFDGPLAVDSAGDVFIADAGVEEMLRMGTGYAQPVTLPFNGLKGPNGVAVDGAGNVFVSDAGNARVVELPRAGASYGPQTTVPTGGLSGPIGVDGAGDLFILAATGVVELPRTKTGYGVPATLPFSDLNGPSGIAVDSAGDVFVANSGNLQVLELPRAGTGYGSQTTFFGSSILRSCAGECDFVSTWIGGIAVDSTGDHLFSAVNGLYTDPTDPVMNISASGSVAEVQTHSVNFGSTYLCASGQTPCSTTLLLNFSVNNNITLGTPKVLTGGAPNLDFTLASGSNCTGALTADSSCAVNVAFSPLALGTRNGTVQIVDGSGDIVATVPISGVGTGEPVAQLSTSTLQFGQIGFGTTETLPLTVTNAGQGTLIVLPSINAPGYAITGNNCGAGLTAGKSCTLDVAFSPAAIGTYDSVLTLQTNGPSNPTVGLDGIANGLSVATSSLQFGTIAYGSSEVLTLTITNMGLPGTVTVATKTSDPSYTVLVTAQNTCLAGIAAGQSCTLPVQFTPDSESNHVGTLTLTASAEGAVTVVGLDGAGLAGVAFTGATGALPFAGLSGPGRIGVDSTGNVFLYDVGNLRVLELPRTSTGFGPQATLLASSGLQPYDGAGLAVDSAGNVYITDAANWGAVIVIPWTGKAYGGTYGIGIYDTTFNPIYYGDPPVLALPTGIAVDSFGNIFLADNNYGALVELARVGTGYTYGNQIGVATAGGVALDSAGDVFAAQGSLSEVQKIPAGYGSQTPLPFNGASSGVAVDNVGNLFVVAGELLELPKVGTGFGGQTVVLPGSFGAVATDSVGNVYVTEGNSALELQRNSPNFGTANVCAPGATTPAPCSQTLTFNYSVNSNVGFGTPKILTGGKPNLDFTLAAGSTCTGTVTAGSFCTLNVTFAPLAAGPRTGTVEIIDADGNVRSTTPISGLGVAPPG